MKVPRYVFKVYAVVERIDNTAGGERKEQESFALCSFATFDEAADFGRYLEKEAADGHAVGCLEQ
jgi:hypothetical protein